MDDVSSIQASDTKVRLQLDSLVLLKAQMDELRNYIHSYIKNVQDLIIKKKTKYEVKLSEFQNVENQLNNEIDKFKNLRENLLKELSVDILSKDESVVKFNEMKIKQDELNNQKQEFVQKLNDLEEELNSKLLEINKQKDIIKNQTDFVNDKLFQFEQLLGLRIENFSPSNLDNSGSSDIEMIKFVFKNIDPNDFNAEVYFTFDPVKLSIYDSFPELDPSFNDTAVQAFVKSKDITVLWKLMRSELRKAILS